MNAVRAFRHRNYRLFFSGQIVSLVGTFLTQYATAWFVYRLTHRTALLGMVLFFGQLPVFILSPFAGVWTERVRRRNFIVVTQVLSMVQSLGLAAVAFWLGQNAHAAVGWLIGLAVFQGIVNAFDLPARQAFLIEMVPDRADLPNAIALNSTMVHGARVLGPALAGLIIARLGESLCFFLDGISYVAVIVSLLLMAVVPPPHKPRGPVLRDLADGVRYIWGFTPIRTLLLFMAAISLFSLPTMMVMMPVFGAHFGIGHKSMSGPETYGILGMASGLGALFGSIQLAMRKTVLGLGQLIGVAVGVFGLAEIGFGFSDHLWLSLLILPLIGWGTITSFAGANTIIQTLVDDDKRARVMSFFGMAFLGMAPFGSLLAGKATEWLTPAGADHLVGASRALIASGVITILSTIVYLTQLPAVRRAARPAYIARGILPGESPTLAVAEEIQAEG